MIKIAHACVRRVFGIFEVDALYVAHYLNNAGVFEFNPYEGVPVRLRHPISEAERK